MTHQHRALWLPASCQDTISFTVWSPGNQPGTRLSSDLLVGDTSRSWPETSPGTIIGVTRINLQTRVTHYDIIMVKMKGSCPCVMCPFGSGFTHNRAKVGGLLIWDVATVCLRDIPNSYFSRKIDNTQL